MGLCCLVLAAEREAACLQFIDLRDSYAIEIAKLIDPILVNRLTTCYLMQLLSVRVRCAFAPFLRSCQ
jgi:hypothetical protein